MLQKIIQKYSINNGDGNGTMVYLQDVIDAVLCLKYHEDPNFKMPIGIEGYNEAVDDVVKLLNGEELY